MPILGSSLNNNSLGEGGIVEARKQLSNHLEDDLQMLIEFDYQSLEG